MCRVDESLNFARLFMALSSVSPLFVLWAIRGNDLVPDPWFIGFCAFMVVLPNGVLALRIRLAYKRDDKRSLRIGKADDHRSHLFVYLVAILLPLYSQSMGTWRELAAVLAALALIVWLFWYMNLHYVNILFALAGYRVFTVSPEPDTINPHDGNTPFVIISRHKVMERGSAITAYRLSNTVYLEACGCH